MKLLTDCAADLAPDEITCWGIDVLPLFIQFPGEEVDSTKITPDEFYNRLRAMVPQVPTTAQPSIGMITDAYKRLTASGEEVLSIHISSGLSGTVLTAAAAAKELPDAKISVVDTMTLSPGERFQVLTAAMAAKKGWPTSKILERLDAVRAATQIAFTLETLDYLARGGRIGRVQAIASTILKIKPIITVEKADGKYSTLGKGRTVQQTMSMMVEHFVKVLGDKPVWVNVVHGQYAEKAETFADMLKSALKVKRLDILRISPVLGVHTGPGVVGAGIVPMELIEDLQD